MGWWLLGCVTSGPRALPESWDLFAWPDSSHQLWGEVWGEMAEVPQDWQSPQVSASEVHLSQWWCGPGVDADACWTGAVAGGETRNTAWRGLSAVTDGHGKVSQMVVDVGSVPSQGAWGISLSLRVDAVDGKLIDWSLALVRWAENRLTARIDLGPELSHGVEQTSFYVPGPDWASVIESPSSLRKHTVAGLDVLLLEVERGIAAHEVRKCIYGRYYGDGTPRCDPVALSPQEEVGALEQSRATLKHRIRLLEQDAEVLHGMVKGALPGSLLSLR